VHLVLSNIDPQLWIVFAVHDTTDHQQLFRGVLDLSPKNRTMTTMRFPDNVTQWRFQHEEEALFRRADHQGNQAA
jgi:hypothetical protein